MFLKLTDAETGKTWYVNVDRLVLIEKVDPDFLVTFATSQPVVEGCRTIRLVGSEAGALLAYLEANAWKGGGR